eukprot:TRINITY_DN13168_c0_g1_i11.p1 TRINITY_DN13168_c0_g1~~TRINITY_DN13168_c0_g1_i11.p1  ORF type:complete len:535 (-),score=116.19 TRINITY_DN13168_c0_g1_i11:238-1674(-)
MIERIRKQRARLVASLPSADRELQMAEEVGFNKSVIKAKGGIPITSFQQEPEETGTELKQFKTVLLTGSLLTDSSFSQIFQISATVLGQSNSYYQCSFPEVLKKSNSLNIASRKELMETLQLKSSKFDVSKEGLLNVYYKHPKNSSAKTVTEKDLLLGLLIFLQGLGESVVLFLHNKDTLLPTLLAKINHYELFDNFRTIVHCCCDLSGLALTLRMDNLWSGKDHPNLRAIAENVDGCNDKEISQENASSVLGTTLSKLMQKNELTIQRVLEMSNKVSLVQYMTAKVNVIKAVKVEFKARKPDLVELIHSHQAFGTSTQVQLIWTTLEEIKKMLKSSDKKSASNANVQDTGDADNQLKNTAAAKAKLLSAENWETKTYKCFLAPGSTTINGDESKSLELRVPALQLRLTELRGKYALVEKHPDFSLCHIESEPSTIQKSDLSMFPIISVTARNTTAKILTLDSKDISEPIATVRLTVD